MSAFFKKLSLSMRVFAGQLPGSGGAVPLGDPLGASDVVLQWQRIAGNDVSPSCSIDASAGGAAIFIIDEIFRDTSHLERAGTARRAFAWLSTFFAQPPGGAAVWSAPSARAA
jgi:hypothetical protein